MASKIATDPRIDPRIKAMFGAFSRGAAAGMPRASRAGYHLAEESTAEGQACRQGLREPASFMDRRSGQ